MKRSFKVLAVVAAVSVLASCRLASPVAITNNKIGTKRGVAERTIWFNFQFGHTDLGVATAAKNGGITKVATVDFHVRQGLFKKTLSTVVTGE